MRIRRIAGAAVAGVIMAAMPMVAMADDYPGPNAPEKPVEVLGVSVEKPVVKAVAVKAAPATLPVTGSDLAGTAGIGVALVGLGVVLTRKSRKSTGPVTA